MVWHLPLYLLQRKFTAGLVWDFKGNHLVVLNREPLDFKLNAQNDIEYTGSMGDVFAKLDNMLHMG